MSSHKSIVFQEIERVWQNQADEIMVISDDQPFTFKELSLAVSHYRQQFEYLNIHSVALLADNSWSWLVIDLACQQANIVLLPLPLFFSAEQIAHSVKAVGCELLIIDAGLSIPEDVNNVLVNAPIASNVFADLSLIAYELDCLKQDLLVEHEIGRHLPVNTSKITFTSGTTGSPKGVCLSQQNQFVVAQSIAENFSVKENKHLAILPLATLLENIAGLYAPLFNGAILQITSLKTLGFEGSSQLNFATLTSQISKVCPASFITTPEILKGLLACTQRGWLVPKSLTFVAVGGAHVSADLIAAAHKCGIPAYQGYGLSECGSVVSLNHEHNAKLNSTGKPLSHLTLTIKNGELIVQGNTFLGYLSQPDTWGQGEYTTGDLGEIDTQGYLTITGRKKNVLISSFGRNISPEWLEAKLLAHPEISQAYVFGDAKPFCCVGISPFCGEATFGIKNDNEKRVIKRQINKFIEALNKTLPDYARLKTWFLLTEPLTVASGLLTENGRAKRAKLTQRFSQQLAEIYQ